MQEINWNNFKAKFNGKEQISFEWLCYLLFCHEFNQSIGIARYKNQAGIETNPIEVDNEKIGWQAKFYDTRLAEHKEDFIKSIDTAKTRHPEINKIIFYLNQDFGQGRQKNDPEYKIEIEQYANNKGIEIEWRTSSFFESPFVCEENATIAQHFFGFKKSVLDFIDELLQHTDSILNPIRSVIRFNECEIKIDRSQVIKDLNAILSKSSLVILSGEGGAGKTAVVKDFYELVKEKVAFFLFKATEFNLTNINQLFKNYGDFTLSDFINEHKNIAKKYIVIDSAEKLSDIEHQEVFQEFLSALLDNDWKIIFTTRHSYLDDLKYQLIEAYSLNFQPLNIENLTVEELVKISETYKFNLPKDKRVLELLHNPFYLNEYLQNYDSLADTISFSGFKDTLWNKQIARSTYRQNNTHRKRENCFITIAQRRANEGHFFVKVDECDDDILQRLEDDESIKYDPNAGGYFITHDIYEEWALEKIIERAFLNSKDYRSFYQAIGSSLPIRRAFRNWLSEKLFINKEDVKSFIETTVNDDKIESYWKDEILVSVLLSDYSRNFIQLLERELLDDNQKLLVKVVFLLRIACKEIDENFLSLLGISKTEGFALETLFTRPRGSGWDCVIGFINKHKEKFGLSHINIILPMLQDWNNKNKQGETTKKAGQIALYYYDRMAEENGFGYRSRDETEENLINTILNGSFELKDELTNIFNEVVSRKEVDHRSKYYGLIQATLSSVADSSEIVSNLPEQVIRLADLFWFKSPDKTDWRYDDSGIGVEQYFCLHKYRFNYFPASAFQTPVFQLLRFAPRETTNFILSFTNKTVECYSKSELKDEVEEIEIFINKTTSIKQYISDRLWKMYRGTHVSTNLLESIHMALEKWLLEIAKTMSKDILESWCLYLLKNSKSASITAVITSLVLAQPDKLFNVAATLFQTKELFFYDTHRYISDQSVKSLYSMGYGLNYQHKLFQDERIKTCDDPHRKSHLENLALQYQFFKGDDVSDQEAENRQQILWNIFDKYYEQLLDPSVETETDKTWRLYLARMDRRNMRPTVEEKEGQILINFNPEIDPELKKYSEESVKKSSDAMKYSSLHLWSHFRFDRNEDKYKQYEKYENNPQLVITETREIIEELQNNGEGDFRLLFNRSIPPYTCSVLIRDFFDVLNEEDAEFCRSVITEFASLPLRAEGYFYQISDGTEPSIVTLPQLIRLFPQHKEQTKIVLLLLLFNPWKEILAFVIRGMVNDLWNVSFEDAHSLFLAYLLLKPKYDDLRKAIKKENYKKGIREHSELQVLEHFIEKYETTLERVITNDITYDELENLDEIDLETLIKAFGLLPLETENNDHKKFLNVIFPIFSKKLFTRDQETDYKLKHGFLEKFAVFILTSKKKEIEEYLKSFVDNFSISRDMASFFSEFVSAEDRLNHYEEFWVVWETFYQKIVEICKKERAYHYTDEIVHNYLLAWPYWRKDVKEWHSLKDREKIFFKKVAEDMGHHPSVLYSISKVLNEIGSRFLEDGIFWISNILQNNPNLFSDELEVNTIYYIENISSKYILKNRHKVKISKQIKDQVLVILNFLLERGSVRGYLLREDIL